jgi:hypothetical protein
MSAGKNLTGTVPAGRTRAFERFLNDLPKSDPLRRQIEAAERRYLTDRLDRATVEESIYADQMHGPRQQIFVV